LGDGYAGKGTKRVVRKEAHRPTGSERDKMLHTEDNLARHNKNDPRSMQNHGKTPRIKGEGGRSYIVSWRVVWASTGP